MRGLLAAALLLWSGSGFAGSPPSAFQSVVVKRGDTLWGIANLYLKDPAKWDEILKYNRLPSSDPTVALPGMTLRVPVALIKEDMRAAKLVYLINKVNFRRKETADWKAAAQDMELFRGDGLRTYDDSRAKVQFLNKEFLSLEPNSMAIIKPVNVETDVVLKSGGIFVGHSRVATVSATIVPKTRDTQFSARVRQDLSTLVEVYTGKAAVQAQGQSVDVTAGQQSEVKMGLAPAAPRPIADLPDFEARAAEFTGSEIQGEARVRVAKGAQLAFGSDADSINKARDAGNLSGEVDSLRVGLPISGYRVQASRSREFDKVVFDKNYDPEDKIDLKSQNLPPGVYWWRVALIDLLGVEGKFSAPRLYSVGLNGAAQDNNQIDLKDAVVLIKPADDEEVSANVYQVQGLVKFDSVSVTVNGKPVRRDDGGNFTLDVKLKSGPNDLVIEATDPAGNSMTITRRLTAE